MMTSATEQFFNTMSERGYEPLLQRAAGTVRIDLARNGSTKDIEHWYVRLDRGRVGVSHEDGDADCVVHTDRKTFDRIASGQANAMAALLRSEISYEGNPTLLVLLQRLFPWPVAQHEQDGAAS
jgi:SCP-2 sterol transfer family protein